MPQKLFKSDSLFVDTLVDIASRFHLAVFPWFLFFIVANIFKQTTFLIFGPWRLSQLFYTQSVSSCDCINTEIPCQWWCNFTGRLCDSDCIDPPGYWKNKDEILSISASPVDKEWLNLYRFVFHWHLIFPLEITYWPFLSWHSSVNLTTTFR